MSMFLFLLLFLTPPHFDAGLMCPRPMCPRPKILGCYAPWTKRPLDIETLTDVSRPWTASSMELAPSAAIAVSVGLRHLMDQWGVWPASPTPLTRFINYGLAPLRRMHARPTHRTPPLRSANGMGWDGSVRDKMAKGHFVQGMQHPRIFGLGHIGRGRTNIAHTCLLTCFQSLDLEIIISDTLWLARDWHSLIGNNLYAGTLSLPICPPASLNVWNNKSYIML